MERLVFTVARGKPRYAEMAMGLGRSLSLIGDTTPRAIVTDIPGYDWKRYYDFVFEPGAPRSALDKLLASDYLDAKAVYALDCDSLAFKRLDPIFAYCSGMPFAVQGGWQREGIWHGVELGPALKGKGLEKIARFNGGALYYQPGPSFETLLGEMKCVEKNYADSGFGDFRGNASEEVCIALAMASTGLGEVIPDETDFMHTGTGLIGSLRMDILKNECALISRREGVRFVEPTIFHASAYAEFRVYWKQLQALERLERYEDRHPPGYRSFGFRLRRSIERRLLRIFRRTH